MNGRLPSTGSDELRSVFPSRLRSNVKKALTCLLIGHSVAVQTDALASSIGLDEYAKDVQPQSG
jgi:hypothetical protein